MKDLNLFAKFIFLSFFGFSTLVAESNDEDISFYTPIVKPKECEKKIESSQGPILKGVLLIPNRSDLNPPKYSDIQGIQTHNLELPGNIMQLESFIGSKYFRKLITKDNINLIKREIIQYYKQHNHPIISVSTPSQDLHDGVLQLVVIDAKVGRVDVKGNKWFKDDQIEKYIRLKSGDCIDSDILEGDLFWLNRNPFRQASIIYTPGEKDHTTDIEVLVKDRLPFRLYAGLNNNGNDITGNNRFITGANFYFLNQLFYYQYSTDTDFDRFYAHTGYYTAFLPWRNELSFFGGYSHVDGTYRISETTPIFRTSGFSAQVSMRYNIPFRPRNALLQEFIWGADFKRTNNNLEFGGVPVFGKFANITQGMLAYNLGYTTKKTTTTFEIESYFSPGKWVSDQTNEDYDSLRAHAKNQYIYGRSSFTFKWNFIKEFAFLTFLRGQIASENLLPSEEYGLGGYDTIRGYKERIVNFDNAFVLNLEIRKTPVQPLKMAFLNKSAKDRLELLVFFDFAWGSKHKAVEGEKKHRILYSIGPGARYSIVPYLTCRVDWGIQLKNLHIGSSRRRVHFSVVAGF